MQAQASAACISAAGYDVKRIGVASRRNLSVAGRSGHRSGRARSFTRSESRSIGSGSSLSRSLHQLFRTRCPTRRASQQPGLVCPRPASPARVLRWYPHRMDLGQEVERGRGGHRTLWVPEALNGLSAGRVRGKPRRSGFLLRNTQRNPLLHVIERTSAPMPVWTGKCREPRWHKARRGRSFVSVICPQAQEYRPIGQSLPLHSWRTRSRDQMSNIRKAI